MEGAVHTGACERISHIAVSPGPGPVSVAVFAAEVKVRCAATTLNCGRVLIIQDVVCLGAGHSCFAVTVHPARSNKPGVS